MLAVNMMQQLTHPSLVKGNENHLIRHWREAQTGQPAAGRILDIPRGEQSIDSRNCKQNDMNFMPAVEIPVFDEKSEWKVWLNRFKAIVHKEDGIPNRSWMSCYRGCKGFLKITCLYSCLQIISGTMNL